MAFSLESELLWKHFGKFWNGELKPFMAHELRPEEKLLLDRFHDEARHCLCHCASFGRPPCCVRATQPLTPICSVSRYHARGAMQARKSQPDDMTLEGAVEPGQWSTSYERSLRAVTRTGCSPPADGPSSTPILATKVADGSGLSSSIRHRELSRFELNGSLTETRRQEASHPSRGVC
jgi:hypothetical protein